MLRLKLQARNQIRLFCIPIRWDDNSRKLFPVNELPLSQLLYFTSARVRRELICEQKELNTRRASLQGKNKQDTGIWECWRQYRAEWKILNSTIHDSVFQNVDTFALKSQNCNLYIESFFVFGDCFWEMYSSRIKACLTLVKYIYFRFIL